MRKLKFYMSDNILKLIYNSLIMPFLYYGISLWGFECDRLLTPQKICVRIMTSSFPLEHMDKLFEKLSILKIHDLFKSRNKMLYANFTDGLPILKTYFHGIISLIIIV